MAAAIAYPMEVEAEVSPAVAALCVKIDAATALFQELTNQAREGMVPTRAEFEAHCTPLVEMRDDILLLPQFAEWGPAAAEAWRLPPARGEHAPYNLQVVFFRIVRTLTKIRKDLLQVGYQLSWHHPTVVEDQEDLYRLYRTGLFMYAGAALPG
jgi:hypothetical protein